MIKDLLQVPRGISRVTTPKFYGLSSQADLEQCQRDLLKVVFEPLNERDLLLPNRHKLKGSGIFVPKDFPFAEGTKQTKNKVKC